MNIIPKMQTGGMALPFADYLMYDGFADLAAVQQAAAKLTSTKEDDNNLKLKDLLDLAKQIDGLPSDMTRTEHVMKRLFAEANLYNNGELDLGSLQTAYLSLLQQLKTSTYNKKQFDLAQKTVDLNGGLNEAAIDQYGRILTQDADRNIHYRRVDELKDVLDKEIVLTNNDLLVMRSEDPSLAFKNDVLSIVNNGIGYDKVLKLIQDTISKVGESNSNISGYSAKQSGEIINGLELLASANQLILKADANGGVHYDNPNMTIDGLYKNKVITKDQKMQMQMAYNYLMSTMPKNALSWLSLKAMESGLPNKETLVMSLLNSYSESTYEFDTDYLDKLNIDGTKKEGADGGSKKEHEMGAVQTWLTGHGDKSVITIQNGTSHGMAVQTVGAPITSKSGEVIGETTLNNVMTSQFGGILDFENATMGDQQIVGFDNVVINGSAIYSMDLPIDEEYYNATGQVRPDVKFLPLIEKAEDEIRVNNIDPEKDPDKANAIYRKYNLPVKYDANGLTITSTYQRFGVLNGYATLEAFAGDDSFDLMSDWIEEVDNENEINSKVRILNHGRGEKDKKKWDMKSGWDSLGLFFDAHDTMYKGTIFIPVKNNYINAMVSSGNLPSEERIESYEQKIQDRDRYNLLVSLFNPQGTL